MKRLCFKLLLPLVGYCVLLTVSASAHVGTGIVVDRQGRVYFTDTIRNRIWRLDPAGSLTALASDVHVDFLALDSDGNPYIVEETIWRITPKGESTEVFPASKGNRNLGHPLTIDSRGNLYLAQRDCQVKGESQLWKKTPDGRLLLVAGSHWGHTDGKADQARFTCLNTAAWGPDHSLYVRDGQEIRKVMPDGTVTTLPGGAQAGFAEDGDVALRRRMGLAVDTQHNVYVANYWKRSVLKLTPAGKISTVVRSEWPWVPTGVAVVGSDVYVLERLGNPYGPTGLLTSGPWGKRLGNLRVRKVSPDGQVTTLVRVRSAP